MFYRGQVIKNITNGITGAYVKTFRATGFGNIIVVMCLDGRQYRAPEEEWKAV
jgi:phosphodiesterase/alkaline phosphatase D-like protein